MTDLSKGVLDVHGFKLTKTTKITDFENLPEGIVDIQKSKRGNTYIKFLVPIHSNGVDVIVHVSFYTDSELPEIELYPDIRNMQKADNDWFGCRTLLRASQKWLEGVLGESIEANGDVIIIRTPFVRISSCITYSHRDGCERGGHIEIAFE